MILPDVNLLVHAYNEGTAWHPKARPWLEKIFSGSEPVALSWPTITGFLRLTTSRSVMENPLPVIDALAVVREWLEQPVVRAAVEHHRDGEIDAHRFAPTGSGANESRILLRPFPDELANLIRGQFVVSVSANVVKLAALIIINDEDRLFVEDNRLINLQLFEAGLKPAGLFLCDFSPIH